MKKRNGWLVLSFMLAGLLLYGLAVPVHLQRAAAQAQCTIVTNTDVTVYSTADTSASPSTFPAGGEAYVMGETYDHQWIGFDPGVAQAGNLGLARLRWVQASTAITLQGDCTQLPQINPLPANVCALTFGDTVTTYLQPDTNTPAFTTLGPNDYALVAGKLSAGWYGWSDDGAQAGSTGTTNLRWVQDSGAIQLVGTCDQLPTFYPVPKLVCTLLTGGSANSYIQPSDNADSTMLPGMLVQVLAKTADQWYGYDPADAQNGAAGVLRLRWIKSSDVDQLQGDCGSIPTVDPAPIQLTPDNNNQQVTVHTGDTLVIFLPADAPADAYQWVEIQGNGPTNDPAVLQQQGDPQFGPSGDRFGNRGAATLTYQAVGAGQTTLSLAYSPVDNPAAASQDTFSVSVTVVTQ